MTSVLYGSGLNYQVGNPVRQEIVAVRRETESLRKQVDVLTEENLLYRKYLLKLLEKDNGSNAELSKELQALAHNSKTSSNGQREPGGGTVQGAGFRR
jgi:hypothetical protein